MEINLTRKEENKIWKYINKTPSCWLWTGSGARGSYGTKWFRGKLWIAHRFMYTLLVGPIPPGKLACHICDIPRCVNPSHIFLGTHKENSQDASRKGRLKGRKKRNYKSSTARK